MTAMWHGRGILRRIWELQEYDAKSNETTIVIIVIYMGVFNFGRQSRMSI